MSETNTIEYLGEVSICQICERKIDYSFVDGKMQYGPWAIMCTICHSQFGIGFGPGKGQMYVRDQGKFVKIRG